MAVTNLSSKNDGYQGLNRLGINISNYVTLKINLSRRTFSKHTSKRCFIVFLKLFNQHQMGVISRHILQMTVLGNIELVGNVVASSLYISAILLLMNSLHVNTIYFNGLRILVNFD